MQYRHGALDDPALNVTQPTTDIQPLRAEQGLHSHWPPPPRKELQEVAYAREAPLPLLRRVKSKRSASIESEFPYTQALLCFQSRPGVYMNLHIDS